MTNAQRQKLKTIPADVSDADAAGQVNAALGWRTVESAPAREAMAANKGALAFWRLANADPDTLPEPVQALQGFALMFVNLSAGDSVDVRPGGKHRAALDGAVAAGIITQDQADDLLALARVADYTPIDAEGVRRGRAIIATQTTMQTLVDQITAAITTAGAAHIAKIEDADDPTETAWSAPAEVQAAIDALEVSE